MKEQLNNQLLHSMWRWRKVLLIIFATAFVLSIIFSSSKFIKPLYKSTATLYPINITSYSNESETEQMLQILESYDLKKAVIDSLDLYKHYKINRDAPYANEKILNHFDQRVTVKRTQYESVKIEVLDRYPKHAYMITKEIMSAYNTLALNLMRKKTQEYLLIAEDLFKHKQHEVDSIKQLLDTLIIQTGLIEYNILKESMRGSFQYMNSSSADDVHAVLSEKSLELYYNQMLLEGEIEVLIEVKSEYENALSDSKKIVVFSDVISEPTIPQKKSWPLRWIIILISVASTMFVSLASIIIIEQVQKK